MNRMRVTAIRWYCYPLTSTDFASRYLLGQSGARESARVNRGRDRAG